MIVNEPATSAEWIDPDDAPELDDAWFDQADFKINREVVRRGRPPGRTKQAVSLRLDADVLAKWRATGPGWQSRMNEVLRKAVG